MQPETPSDPPVRFVTYGETQLAYTDEGEGPPIIAIAGLPGTVRDFRWLAPTLADSFRVVRLDLPGFGKSPRTGYRGMSIEERAAPVLWLIEALELGSVTVVSHSSGGTVAAHLARFHPELIRAVALLACPGPRSHYPAALYRLTAALYGTQIGRAAMVPLQRTIYAAMGFPGYLTDDERSYSTLDAAASYFDTHSENVRGMDCPTLVAWAADDQMIPADIFLALEEIAPAGPRLRFEGGGHNIQKTHAIEIGEAVAQLAQQAAVA